MLLVTITLVSAILPGLYCTKKPMNSNDLGKVNVEMGYEGMKHELCHEEEGYKNLHNIMVKVEKVVKDLKEKNPECAEAKVKIVDGLQNGYKDYVTDGDPTQLKWWKNMKDVICPLDVTPRTQMLQDVIRSEGDGYKSYKCEEIKPSACCDVYHTFFEGLSHMIDLNACGKCICTHPPGSTFTNSECKEVEKNGSRVCNPQKNSYDPKECPPPKGSMMMGRK